MADQGNCLVVLNINSDILENGDIRLGGIIKSNILNIDSTLLSILHCLGSLFWLIVALLLLLFHDKFGDFIERTLNFTNLLQVRGDVENVEQNLPVVDEEGRHFTNSEVVTSDFFRGKISDSDETSVEKALEEKHHDCVVDSHVSSNIKYTSIVLFKSFDTFLFTAKCLDSLDVADSLRGS